MSIIERASTVYIYIYNPVIFPGEDNGIIYIPTQNISVVSYALQGDDFSGRGFSWGDNTSENGARKSFGEVS